MTPRIRVFIVEDHPVFRRGLVDLFVEDTGISVVGDAGDGETGWPAIERLRPDVALLDIELSARESGLDIARRIASARLQTRVVYLTVTRSPELLQEALALGAFGFVVKTSSPDEIVRAVKAVAAGQHYVCGSMSGLLLDRRRQVAALEERWPRLRDLTSAERAVLRLLADGNTAKQIAVFRDVSTRTAENQIASIRTKLGLQGHHQLMKFAIEHKRELPLPDPADRNAQGD